MTLRSGAWLLISFGILSVFLFLAIDMREFITWFFFAVACFSLLYLWGTQLFALRGIQVMRTLSSHRLSAGDTFIVQLTLTRRFAWWPLIWISIQEQVPPKSLISMKNNLRLILPLWRKTINLSYEMQAMHRGQYRLTTVSVGTGDLFGVMDMQMKYPLVDSFIVYPKMVRTMNWNPSDSGRDGHQYTSQKRVDESTQAFGIREYIQGDRLGRIHWGASARTGSLKSKEFERQQMNDVFVVVDASLSSYPMGDLGHYQPNESFELAMSIVASSIKHLYSHKQRFEMITHIDEYVKMTVAQSHSQFTRCLDALATLHLADCVPFENFLRQMNREFQPDAKYVICSPSVNAEMLRVLSGLRRRAAVDWIIPCLAGKQTLEPFILTSAQSQGIAISIVSHLDMYASKASSEPVL